MALSVGVPRDLSKIKTKVALNLTARQLICFGAGLVVAVPSFFFFKRLLGMEPAALCCMVLCVPFFFVGMYEKNSLPAEKLLYFAFRAKYIRPEIRPKKIVTKQEAEERIINVRKEIEELESKADKKGGRNREIPRRAEEAKQNPD